MKQNKRKVIPYLKGGTIFESGTILKSYHKEKESCMRKRNEAWAAYIELFSML